MHTIAETVRLAVEVVMILASVGVGLALVAIILAGACLAIKRMVRR